MKECLRNQQSTVKQGMAVTSLKERMKNIAIQTFCADLTFPGDIKEIVRTNQLVLMHSLNDRDPVLS